MKKEEGGGEQAKKKKLNTEEGLSVLEIERKEGEVQMMMEMM